MGGKVAAGWRGANQAPNQCTRVDEIQHVTRPDLILLRVFQPMRSRRPGMLPALPLQTDARISATTRATVQSSTIAVSEVTRVRAAYRSVQPWPDGSTRQPSARPPCYRAPPLAEHSASHLLPAIEKTAGYSTT